MNKKLFRISNRGILYLFNFLFGITFICAVTFPNLIVGDNLTTGAGTTIVTTMFLIFVVTIVVAIIVYPKIRHIAWRIFVQHQLLTASLLMGVVMAWQLLFIICVHPAIGFDVGAIHLGLIEPQNSQLQAYFSINPNNLPLLLILHGVAQLLHSTSWLAMDLVTMIVVDLSALLNIISIRIIDRQKTALGIYIHAIWLSIFPMIIVPYTDTWVLPLVSCYMFCYFSLRFGHLRFRSAYFVAFLLGLSIAGAYFMKPSAIIPVIAIILIEILYWIQNHTIKLFTFRQLTIQRINHGIDRILTFRMMIPMIVLLTLGGAYFGGNYYLNNQNYVVVNRQRAIPAIHFMSMGVSGEGGYNAHDALIMAELPTKEARVAYSRNMLVSRMKKMGVLGYGKFLLKKQRNNTADGTFAWVKEGHFINDGVTHPAHRGFAGSIRQFVYLYGTHIGDFRFLAQFWWVIWLGMIFFSWRNRQMVVQLFRLAIIGGMLFLLMFEGGRSRYLIQFLPIFLLMATLVAEESCRLLGGLFKVGFARRQHKA